MPRQYGRRLDKTNFKKDRLKEKTKAGRPDLVEKPRWKRSRRVAGRLAFPVSPDSRNRSVNHSPLGAASNATFNSLKPFYE
jgi:hypothetical protein